MMEGGAMSQKICAASRSWKIPENKFSSTASRRKAAWLTPYFSPEETHVGLLSNRKVMNLCHFSPLSLWSFSTVATETNSHAISLFIYFCRYLTYLQFFYFSICSIIFILSGMCSSLFLLLPHSCLFSLEIQF